MRVAALLQTMDSDDSLDTDLDTEAEAGTFMRETAGLNRDFYLGSLLAMHVNYRTLSSIVRLTLLRKEIFPKSAPSDYHLDPKDPLLREVSASMEDFRHNQWMTMAEELLDDEHMDRLLGAPEALYPDEQSAGTQMVDGRPLDFMAGYTFGSCNVMMAIHSGIGKTSISLAHYLPHITPV